MRDGSDPLPLEPTDEDYQVFDRYLKTAVQLLEGVADVEEAHGTLSRYLEFHRQQGLQPELEELLIQLFFHKCAKEFLEE